MSLLDLGAQCPVCRTVDFLPILCLDCQTYFCSNHLNAHDCDCATKSPAVAHGHPTVALQRCALDKCNKPSLEAFFGASDSDNRTPARCINCQAAFCAEHRHPKSHSCQVEPVSAPRNEAARALLAKNFPCTSQSKTTVAPRAAKIPTDPAKLAQYRKIELMKMRHRAVPVDPKDKSTTLPQDNRRYFNVGNKAFWARKSLSTGKVLDLLATHLGLSSDSSPLQLLKVSPEGVIECLNDQLFSSQVEDTDTVVVREI